MYALVHWIPFFIYFFAGSVLVTHNHLWEKFPNFSQHITIATFFIYLTAINWLCLTPSMFNFSSANKLLFYFHILFIFALKMRLLFYPHSLYGSPEGRYAYSDSQGLPGMGLPPESQTRSVLTSSCTPREIPGAAPCWGILPPAEAVPHGQNAGPHSWSGT